MPQILTRPISPKNDFSKEMFSYLLKNRANEITKAVAMSKMMREELSTSAFDYIKQSLARSLGISTTQIHFFGSRVMGLANEESDLDIYIDMENSFHSGLSKEKQQLYLDQFEMKLRYNSDFEIVVEIRDATVPILVLDYVKNVPSSIKCRWIILLTLFKRYSSSFYRRDFCLQRHRCDDFKAHGAFIHDPARCDSILPLHSVVVGLCRL